MSNKVCKKWHNNHFHNTCGQNFCYRGSSAKRLSSTQAHPECHQDKRNSRATNHLKRRKNIFWNFNPENSNEQTNECSQHDWIYERLLDNRPDRNMTTRENAKG